MCQEYNGNYSKALECLNKSLKISEEIEDKELIARSLRSIGHVYHSKGDYENAINYNQRSLSLSKTIKSLVSTEETAKELYDNYKALGKYKQALEMYELYIVTRDSLLSERNKDEIIRQEYKYAYEKQAIVDSLAFVKLQNEQELKLQKSKTQQLVLIIGVILLLAFLAYFYNRFQLIRKQKRIIDQEISERKKTEKELKKAKIIAETATQAKGDFLANMSHEIRTPMNAIMGMNYLLQKTELTSKQFDYAKKIERSAQNLLGIINDILDFSKIEAGKIDMEMIDFNLNDVLDNLSNMMSVKAQQKDLELIISKHSDVPTYLVGDPLRLGQVLINLSTNAIKFTEKGEVEVKTEKIELTDKEAFIKFSVKDTGIGLTEEQKGKLFQSFSQADASTTRKYGGTGLGLTISKKLTELMCGEIGVDSVPGEGSTFHFTARFGLSAKTKEKMRVIPEVLNNMNVLIVDDNVTVLEVMTDYCHDFSFKVQTANNGKKAIEILQKDHTIQTVFMDWKMPIMDGLEAATRIKNDPKIKPKHKIIMV
jgi:signal transduction histidine kinase